MAAKRIQESTKLIRTCLECLSEAAKMLQEKGYQTFSIWQKFVSHTTSGIMIVPMPFFVRFVHTILASLERFPYYFTSRIIIMILLSKFWKFQKESDIVEAEPRPISLRRSVL